MGEKYFGKEQAEELCPFLTAEILDECGSTSTLLKERAAEGEGEFYALFAKKQTAGRGRLNRSFLSPSGGLYFSLILRPKMPPESSTLITAAAAVAATEAIEAVSGKAAEIKWVNDIFIGDKKVCGILCEGKIDPQNSLLEYAVLGVGINVFEPENGFGPEINDIAAALFKGEEHEQIYLKLAARFLNTFKGYYDDLLSKKYMDKYIEKSYLTGREVCYTKNGILHEGRVVGIDRDANLIIDENGIRQKLFSGEVSVKVRGNGRLRRIDINS